MLKKTFCLKLLSILSFTLITLLPAPVSAAVIEVEIKKFKFIPQQLSVNVGDTVIWSNKEKRQYHSVWFKAAGDAEPDYFFPDETYQRTFNQAGTFNYICGPHPKMTGIITVK